MSRLVDRKQVGRRNYDVSRKSVGGWGFLIGLVLTTLEIKSNQKETRAVNAEVLWVSGEVFLLPFEGPVHSPLILYGKAPGEWFQQGTLGILVLDENGYELGIATARAKGEWVGKDEVPFIAEGEFRKPPTCHGTLVFQNNNPVGHPISTVEVRFGISFCEDEP